MGYIPYKDKEREKTMSRLKNYYEKYQDQLEIANRKCKVTNLEELSSHPFYKFSGKTFEEILDSAEAYETTLFVELTEKLHKRGESWEDVVDITFKGIWIHEPMDTCNFGFLRLWTSNYVYANIDYGRYCSIEAFPLRKDVKLMTIFDQ